MVTVYYSKGKHTKVTHRKRLMGQNTGDLKTRSLQWFSPSRVRDCIHSTGTMSNNIHIVELLTVCILFHVAL